MDRSDGSIRTHGQFGVSIRSDVVESGEEKKTNKGRGDRKFDPQVERADQSQEVVAAEDNGNEKYTGACESQHSPCERPNPLKLAQDGTAQLTDGKPPRQDDGGLRGPSSIESGP